jgi:hypothetical protein
MISGTVYVAKKDSVGWGAWEAPLLYRLADVLHPDTVGGEVNSTWLSAG